MNLKESFHNITESMIVGIVMIFVLLPVRVIFVTYITPNWFGSFGLITGIIVLLLVLSRYNKLGIFGRMFWKQSTKISTGKRRYISYFLLGFSLYLWACMVYGINYAENNSTIEAMKQRELQNMTPNEKQRLGQLEKAIESKSVKETSQILNEEYSKMNWDVIILAIPILLLLPILNIDVWALAVSVLNDFTNGYLLHFGTVFLVEVIEVIGIIIYVRYYTRRNTTKTV